MYPAGAPRPGFDPFQQLTDEDGVVFQGSSQENPDCNQARGEQESEHLGFETETSRKWCWFLNRGPALLGHISGNYTWSGCSSVNCNEPNWVKDGRLNETDYT